MEHFEAQVLRLQELSVHIWLPYGQGKDVILAYISKLADAVVYVVGPREM